jgi:hypothetical protein
MPEPESTTPQRDPSFAPCNAARELIAAWKARESAEAVYRAAVGDYLTAWKATQFVITFPVVIDAHVIIGRGDDDVVISNAINLNRHEGGSR